MCNHYFKGIIMLLILSLTLLSTAFAISVTTPEQLVEVLGQTEVGMVELGADIELESINISISNANRYINLNGHTLTLSDSSYIDFEGDGCVLEFYDSTDLGKIVFNDTAIFYVAYISDATGCSIVFEGGSYIVNHGNPIILSHYSSQDTLMNIVVENATFYKQSGSPFNIDNANYDFSNMNVLPLYENNTNYIGFANIYRYINEILPNSSFIFQNGDLYEVDRATTYLRNAYIRSNFGNSNIIVSEQSERIDGKITAPQFDSVHENYSAIEYKPLTVTINDEESFIDSDNLKIVLMGHLKDCFDVQNPSDDNLEGEGTWSEGGIRPKLGLLPGQYNVPIKLVYDKDSDGEYETIIGATALYFEVLSPQVKLKNYWGTSGPFQKQFFVDGYPVSRLESENDIYLVPGEEVEVTIENGDHYENFSIFLRYNEQTKDFSDMELGEDGFMHGTIIVPNYDFAIGVQSRLLDLKVTYDSNNSQNLSETFFYVLEDDGVSILIDDNSLGFTKEDAFFTSWSINSSGSDADQYTRAQVVHFTEPKTLTLYANWQYMENIPSINLSGDIVSWDAYDEDFIAGLHGYNYEYCVESNTDEKIFDSDTTSINLKDICEELGKASGQYEFDIYARVKNSYRISNIYHVEYQYEADQILGDLNNDSEINIIDVRLLLQAYINSGSSPVWSQEELDTMDMDGDETINIIDVRLLLQKYINS